MFNKQLLAILIPLTLSGCGGGSDDGGSSQPKPTPKYTFEFAEFYESAPSANISRCSVYGLRTSGDEDVNVLAVVNESLAPSRNKLLIQNSEGDVERSIGLTGSKEVLLASDVPDGGFVTFYSERLNNVVSATSIEKSLLKENASIMLGYEFDSNYNEGSCLRGNNAPSEYSYQLDFTKQGGSADIFSIATEGMRYMTLDTSKEDYTIETNAQNAIGAVYEKDTGDKDSGDIIDKDELQVPREITDYKFFNLANGTTVELDPLSATGYWTATANTYDLTSAALYVDYQQTPYIWQNLPHSVGDTITYGYDPANNNLSYFLTAEGSVVASSNPSDVWQLNAARQLSVSDLADDLTNDSLDSNNDIDVPAKSTSVGIYGNNLNVYGNGAGGQQAGIQRIAYQDTKGSTTVTHVIYAEASNQQVVPELPDNTITGEVDNYDISVMYTENDQALAALMAEHTNPSITDNSDLSVDPLPVLLTTYEREQLARQKKIIDHYQISTSNP